MIANWVLIVWVTLAGNSAPYLYHTTGGVTHDQCLALQSTIRQQAQSAFPSATVISGCYEMVPR